MNASGPPHLLPWLLLCATGSVGCSDPDTPDPPPLHECAEATELCSGSLEVPLDWSEPEGAQTIVDFGWLPRQDQSRPAQGTIAINTGGPGTVQGTLDILIAAALGPVLEDHDLLMLDPRGFGPSNLVSCPGLDVSSDASIVACAESLGDQATNFHAQHYAADLDAVRAALGIESFLFYGNSYGTVVGQAYAARYPDRVEAMLLDSTVEVADDGYARDADGDPIGAIIRMLDDLCASSPACQGSIPQPHQTLAQVRALAEAGTLGGLTTRELVLALGFIGDPTFARELVAALGAAQDGDVAPLQRLWAMVAPFYEEVDPADLEAASAELAGALPYLCSEWRYSFERDASPSERREQLELARTMGDVFAPFVVDDILSGAFRYQADWCTNWPTPHETPVVPPNGAYPDIPVLMIQGQLDETTPPELAVPVAERFAQSHLMVVPYGSHADTFRVDSCQNQVAREFLMDPQQDLAALPQCSSELLRAIGRFPAMLEQMPDSEGGEGLSEAERVLVTAAYLTAADAIARRPPNPFAFAWTLVAEAGLRGGMLTFDDATGTIILDQVRLASDVAVSGTITLPADGSPALATLTATPDGEIGLAVDLQWSAFEPADVVEVAATIAGMPTTLEVPLP